MVTSPDMCVFTEGVTGVSCHLVNSRRIELEPLEFGLATLASLTLTASAQVPPWGVATPVRNCYQLCFELWGCFFSPTFTLLENYSQLGISSLFFYTLPLFCLFLMTPQRISSLSSFLFFGFLRFVLL